MSEDAPLRDFQSWPPMSVERFAALEGAAGLKISKQSDIYWREVRPFFYRPLAPFCKYDPQKTKRQFRLLAAFQHAGRKASRRTPTLTSSYSTICGIMIRANCIAMRSVISRQRRRTI